MPRKKGSRVPSRAKPVLPDDSITEADVDQNKRREKVMLLLRDFDIEVERRVEKMEADMQMILENIRQEFKLDLMLYPETTRNKLWIDYINQDDTPCNTVRKDSVADTLSSADSVLESVVKKRGRKPKAKQPDQVDGAMLPPPTTTRSTRQRQVLASNQSENMPPPPPTTTRTSRKKALEPPATPMDCGISSNLAPHMFITPKFDPRTPLPMGTIKRKPHLGEVAISLKGSPLQITPPHNVTESVDDWMEKLNNGAIDETFKSKLLQLHKKVGDMLNC